MMTKVNLNNTISNDSLNFIENNELNCCNEGDGENKRDHFKNNNDNSNDNEPTQTSFDESIRLKLYKGYSSHQYCFDCRCNQKRMVTFQSDARYEIFAKKNIFIIEGSRLCSSHLDEKGFVLEEDLSQIKSNDTTIKFYAEAIEELLQNFQSSKNESQLFSQYSSSSPIQENSLK